MDISSSSNIAGLAPASLMSLDLNHIDRVELPVAMWKSRWQMKGYARELLRVTEKRAGVASYQLGCPVSAGEQLE